MAIAQTDATKQRVYRPQLDGLRAFCVIFTIWNHIPGKPWVINGSIGVDIFFALSGWLITSLLMTERREHGTIHVLAFYIRRAFRILPLYYLTILLYGVAVLVAGAHHADKPREFKAAFLYLITLNSEYRTTDVGNLFGHAWTLGIEEKFYIVWPAILFLLARRPWTAMAIGLLAYVLLISAAPDSGALVRGYWGLSVGTALAVLAGRSRTLVSYLRTMPIADCCILAIAVIYALSVMFPGGIGCNLAIGTVAGILVASLWFNQDQLASRFLAFKPFAWVGGLTYAIYLIQTLATNCIEAALNFLHLQQNWILIFSGSYALSIGAAWIVHVLVEKPCIRLGRKIAKGLPRRATLPTPG